MTQLKSLIVCNSIIAGEILLIVVGSVSCGGQMQTQYTASGPTGAPKGASKLSAEFAPCNEPFRPLRVAFVVDNTGSNGADPNKVMSSSPPENVEITGSDYVKDLKEDYYLTKNSDGDFDGVTTNDRYTYRQYAVYRAILQLQKAGLDARKKNPSYPGIDVGITQFPKSANALEQAVFHSGDSTGLPSKMTDVSKIESSTQFKQKLWDTLRFTHKTEGMTPYVTAFNSAQTLLVTEKKPDDSRDGLMILITDGLPTDRVPSAIKAARQPLGKGNKVVVMRYYLDSIDDEAQNREPKKALSGMYKEQGWGAEEFPNFDSYWKALLAIPKEISDDNAEIKSRDMHTSIKQFFDRYLSCKAIK